MGDLDLESIYDQLKDKYDLVLTNAFSLNAGFLVDHQVLFGKSDVAKFYLYYDNIMAIFDIENNEGTSGDHWHPDNTSEALQNVIDFMEGNCKFDWYPME